MMLNKLLENSCWKIAKVKSEKKKDMMVYIWIFLFKKTWDDFRGFGEDEMKESLRFEKVQ